MNEWLEWVKWVKSLNRRRSDGTLEYESGRQILPKSRAIDADDLNGGSDASYE